MKKITEFNKANLKALRVELEAAHKAIEKKFGIQLKAGNISFSGNEANGCRQCRTLSQARRDAGAGIEWYGIVSSGAKRLQRRKPCR